VRLNSFIYSHEVTLQGRMRIRRGRYALLGTSCTLELSVEPERPKRCTHQIGSACAGDKVFGGSDLTAKRSMSAVSPHESPRPQKWEENKENCCGTSSLGELSLGRMKVGFRALHGRG
jgi:hypothetical protein